jgi:hypothetical protein
MDNNLFESINLNGDNIDIFDNLDIRLVDFTITSSNIMSKNEETD